MLVVSSNGLIVHVLGPDRFWAGSASDADIMKCCMNTPWFETFFKHGDIFVLDQGFQRCEEDLQIRSFDVSIPTSKPGQQQLTTLEANESRRCTKKHWVVEWVNTSLKKFKYIDGIVASCGVPHLFVDVRILAAFHDHFFARQYSNFDWVEVAHQMLEKMNTPNLLQELVEKENMTQKTCMLETLESDHFHNLPAWRTWSIEELSSYLSSFQLRLVKSYLANHFAKREHEFQISRETSMPNFSRHNIMVQSPFFIRAWLLSR